MEKVKWCEYFLKALCVCVCVCVTAHSGHRLLTQSQRHTLMMKSRARLSSCWHICLVGISQSTYWIELLNTDSSGCISIAEILNISIACVYCHSSSKPLAACLATHPKGSSAIIYFSLRWGSTGNCHNKANPNIKCLNRVLGHQNSFGALWHRFYKCLELYWRDVTPFYHVKFHHLVFCWWWKTLSQAPLQNLP